MSLKTFCYPAHQIVAVYDEQLCTNGQPDTGVQYLGRLREWGAPASGYRPALFLPAKQRIVVITDKCFGREINARAWIADQIRLIAIARKRKEANACA
ncbi:hypothetical protein [Salinicola endophyticus]|uniref:Uncharacterized protein n=1 Tax=Salinicola endophyticus TaxID=1949083 RepID=A0AB74U278_9GAMM